MQRVYRCNIPTDIDSARIISPKKHWRPRVIEQRVGHFPSMWPPRLHLACHMVPGEPSRMTPVHRAKSYSRVPLGVTQRKTKTKQSNNNHNHNNKTTVISSIGQKASRSLKRIPRINLWNNWNWYGEPSLGIHSVLSWESCESNDFSQGGKSNRKHCREAFYSIPCLEDS